MRISPAKTCAGTPPPGALLSWDNEGHLTAWQNITSAIGSTPALEEALYDGEGWRIEQLDFGVRSRKHDRSVVTNLIVHVYQADEE
ncbi:MAG TPA: hypothetical protein VF792_01540 [Ktedonobacterales bacterium]